MRKIFQKPSLSLIFLKVVRGWKLIEKRKDAFFCGEFQIFWVCFKFFREFLLSKCGEKKLKNFPVWKGQQLFTFRLRQRNRGSHSIFLNLSNQVGVRKMGRFQNFIGFIHRNRSWFTGWKSKHFLSSKVSVHFEVIRNMFMTFYMAPSTLNLNQLCIGIRNRVRRMLESVNHLQFIWGAVRGS